MFYQQTKNKPLKNWKVINNNFNQVKQHNKEYRSSLIESNTKYQPKKSLSKEKIFSKSKQRLNGSIGQNNANNSLYLKGITRDFVNKPIMNNYTSSTPQSKRVTKELQQGNTSFVQGNGLNQQRSVNITQGQIQQQYQNKKKDHSRNNSVSFKDAQQYSFNNGQQDYAMNYALKLKNQRLIQQINNNKYIIQQMKKQFQLFKSLIWQEIHKEKQVIKKIVRQIFIQIQNQRQSMREQIRKQLIVQIETNRAKKNDSIRQSRKTSTELKYQEIKTGNLINLQSLKLQNLSENNILTFGLIDQRSNIKLQASSNKENESVIHQQGIQQEYREYPSSKGLKVQQFRQQKQQSIPIINISQNLSQHNLSHQIIPSNDFQNQKQSFNLMKQLKYCKSSQNLTAINTVQISNANSQNPKKQITSQYSIASDSNKCFPNAKNIQQAQQNKKYNQLLKKYYHLPQSRYPIKNRTQQVVSQKQKLKDRMNHIQKFYGAMQKLKSQIKQIKNISDIKDLKKIKFSQRQTQSQLKQIKLNEIN